MKKKGWCVLASAIIGMNALAQDATVREFQLVANKPIKSAEKDGWYSGGIVAVNINQGALSNWAAGGEQHTFGGNLLLNYGLHYRNGRNTWDNYVELALGFQTATSYNRFRKIDDRIDLTTKLGHQLSKSWYSGFLINFNTQALAGYDYSKEPNVKVSNFISPGKLLFSPGFDYKPNKDFSLFLSPATTRVVFKSDHDFYGVAKFGVDSAKKANLELGAYVTAKYNKAITKWAAYAGRLDLFSNYKHNPGNIDILFTNLVSLKFNKWLATNISLDIIYDDDILKRTQIKEILGIGVTLKLK